MPNKCRPKRKSVEQRMFEAYRSNRAMKLRPEDVRSLLSDDAMATRVTNAAAQEAGNDAPGCDCIDPAMTWADFGASLK
ncbi:MAG: hypothetical protein AAGD07_25085 [Planctomycetota bacterium]